MNKNFFAQVSISLLHLFSPRNIVAQQRRAEEHVAKPCGEVTSCEDECILLRDADSLASGRGVPAGGTTAQAGHSKAPHTNTLAFIGRSSTRTQDRCEGAVRVLLASSVVFSGVAAEVRSGPRVRSGRFASFPFTFIPSTRPVPACETGHHHCRKEAGLWTHC